MPTKYAGRKPVRLPAATSAHPIILPDGSEHRPTVHLARVIAHPNIEIGDYTYYSDFGDVADYASKLAPYLYPGAPEKLTIGRFCQFAHGVRFITASANHPTRGFSTYPFRVFDPQTMDAYAEEVAERGDTVVGNDVWLGYETLVMPGVTIGNGAIAGARSVITRDVPDYAIVAGNPARIVRMRFEPAAVERLNALAWWNWPQERIEACAEAIEHGDLEALEAGWEG